MIKELEELLEDEEIKWMVIPEELEELSEEEQKSIATVLFVYKESRPRPANINLLKEESIVVGSVLPMVGLHESLHAAGAYISGAEMRFYANSTSIGVAVHGNELQELFSGLLPHLVMPPIGFYIYNKAKGIKKAIGGVMASLTPLELLINSTNEEFKTDTYLASEIICNHFGLHGEPYYTLLKIGIIAAITGYSYYFARKASSLKKKLSHLLYRRRTLHKSN